MIYCRSHMFKLHDTGSKLIIAVKPTSPTLVKGYLTRTTTRNRDQRKRCMCPAGHARMPPPPSPCNASSERPSVATGAARKTLTASSCTATSSGFRMTNLQRKKPTLRWRVSGTRKNIMTVHNSPSPSFVLHERQCKQQQERPFYCNTNLRSWSVVRFGLSEFVMQTVPQGSDWTRDFA
ncbi:unnamed protein product [Amoebophrya sp. A120]|nr:unnamed protein product [Amoebophrya sp. A120]|eukprot:GSA120T00024556001.1